MRTLELVGRLYHLGRAERRQRAGRVLEQFQLADAADRPVRTYSGGMRRRPCPRTWSQGRRPNDGNLAAWPGRGRALPGPAPVSAAAPIPQTASAAARDPRPIVTRMRLCQACYWTWPAADLFCGVCGRSRAAANDGREIQSLSEER